MAGVHSTLTKENTGLWTVHSCSGLLLSPIGCWNLIVHTEMSYPWAPYPGPVRTVGPNALLSEGCPSSPHHHHWALRMAALTWCSLSLPPSQPPDVDWCSQELSELVQEARGLSSPHNLPLCSSPPRLWPDCSAFEMGESHNNRVISPKMLSWAFSGSPILRPHSPHLVSYSPLLLPYLPIFSPYHPHPKRTKFPPQFYHSDFISHTKYKLNPHWNILLQMSHLLKSHHVWQTLCSIAHITYLILSLKALGVGIMIAISQMRNWVSKRLTPKAT